MVPKIRSVLCLATLTVFLSGCTLFMNAPVIPPPAIIYTDFHAPIDIDADPTKRGSRVGRAEVANILGIVSTGDASVAAAAKAGGIKTIRHIDYHLFSVLGLYSRFETVVYGDAQ
jgi:hypothetical protein